MPDGEDCDTAKPKIGAARVIAALIGLIVAASCLLVFVFRLSGRILMLDSDVVFLYFVVCGAVAGIGLLFVYRLLPRHKPSSLVEQSGGVAIQPLPQSEVRNEVSQSVQNCLPAALQEPSRIESPVSAGALPRHAARYKASEGGGLAAIVVMIGMAIAFMVGSELARQFLPLVILAGGAVALGMYWYRHGNLA